MDEHRSRRNEGRFDRLSDRGANGDWSIPEQLILPDDEMAFPLGSAQVINSDKLAVVIRIGDKKARRFPWEVSTLWDPCTQRETVDLVIGIQDESDDSIRRIYSGIIGKDPAKRINFVFYKEEGPKDHAKVLIIPETLSC